MRYAVPGTVRGRDGEAGEAEISDVVNMSVLVEAVTRLNNRLLSSSIAILIPHERV